MENADDEDNDVYEFFTGILFKIASVKTDPSEARDILKYINMSAVGFQTMRTTAEGHSAHMHHKIVESKIYDECITMTKLENCLRPTDGHSPLPLVQVRQLLVICRRMCTKYWLTA